MKFDFKLGERVVLIATGDGKDRYFPEGSVGTVKKRCTDGYIVVEFDRNAHNCFLRNLVKYVHKDHLISGESLPVREATINPMTFYT